MKFLLKMAGLEKRRRLSADPSLGVDVLMGVIEGWIAEKGCRDITSMMKLVSSQLTWKSAPTAEALGSVAGLCKRLVEVAPNGVVPACKLALALRYCNNKSPINYTASDIKEWSIYMYIIA